MKLSRSDIVTEALRAGLSYETAEDIAHRLSPECETVHVTKVMRAIVAAAK